MSESNTENKRWLISQAGLRTWLDGIARARTLIAPRQVSEICLYRQVANSDEIAWQGQTPGSTLAPRPILSVKEFFFPATERLFTIQKTGMEIHLEEAFPDWETVVFAVRPCDACGVKLLDALFLNTLPADPFYARRRANTTLIGLGCRELGPNCFCTSVGGAPDDACNVDIMLYETDEGYLAEAVTGKGRFLIPTQEWRETDERHRQSTCSVQFPIAEKEKYLEQFNAPYWTSMSERCLSCRACAYVCPTCHCFAVRDESLSPGKFERLRCWDSCTGENYRRIAGGHRARPQKGERLRNRFFCKFHYFAEQTGLGNTSACTGCGRCIDVCPVGVDITEVILDLGRPA